MITIRDHSDIYLIDDDLYISNLDFEVVMKAKEPEKDEEEEFLNQIVEKNQKEKSEIKF